jgi:hypothetical protein
MPASGLAPGTTHALGFGVVERAIEHLELRQIGEVARDHAGEDLRLAAVPFPRPLDFRRPIQAGRRAWNRASSGDDQNLVIVAPLVSHYRRLAGFLPDAIGAVLEAAGVADVLDLVEILVAHPGEHGEAQIAALERLVGKQALELEFLKGALKNGPRPRSATTSVIVGPLASASQNNAG